MNHSVHAREVKAGDRFAFGRNWAAFLSTLSERRIAIAEQSMAEYLETADLKGLSFLDAGCGSGIFSLAARRMGARVVSFDFDPQSVACALELRRRYFPGDPDWVVAEGSVLDRAFLATLGRFDVVYSWGVLHHTGAMWQALDCIHPLVAPGGRLFVSIYNDQGKASRRWLAVKRLYNRLPSWARFSVLIPAAVFLWWRPFLKDFLLLRPFAQWRQYQERRGMSAWHDIVDWVGGYPFEVAKPEEIFAFYRQRGFTLEKLSTCGGGLGCNQYVFRRPSGYGVAG